MPPEKCLIVATGPHGFPGASQVMSQSLRAYSSAGHEVVYVGSAVPFLFRFVDPLGVRFSILPEVTGAVIREDGAIRSPDVLLVPKLTEAIVTVALEKAAASAARRVIVWGHYLYPYGLAALLATQVLKSSRYSMTVELWLTPTGSDVWEIGPQLQILTEWMLGSVLTNKVVAYTQRFADEIAERYRVAGQIAVLNPMLDISRFERLGSENRFLARAELGIQQDAFVITSHSNMRPVKRPEDVVFIAEQLAGTVNRQVVLLMVGPQRNDLGGVTKRGKCRIVWAGVREKVETVIVAGDAELNCSSHDSFNLSLAEAMACGLVCVSTDVVGVADEIRNSGAGFLFPYEQDVRRLDRYELPIAFLRRLCEDDFTRSELGACARRWALARFSAATRMPDYLKLLAESQP